MCVFQIINKGVQGLNHRSAWLKIWARTSFALFHEAYLLNGITLNKYGQRHRKTSICISLHYHAFQILEKSGPLVPE